MERYFKSQSLLIPFVDLKENDTNPINNTCRVKFNHWGFTLLLIIGLKHGHVLSFFFFFFFAKATKRKHFWGTFSKDFFTGAREIFMKEYFLFLWVYSCLNLKLETMATIRETTRLLRRWLFPDDVLSL